MKKLTTRQEIAKAINFHKYPVINIDLANADDYGIKGTKVNIDFGEEYYIHAEIRAYDDEKYLTTTQGPCVLTDRISYSDYVEMVEYNNAPIIKPEQEILVFLHDSSRKEVYPPVILKTGRLNRFCTTPLTIERYEVL